MPRSQPPKSTSRQLLTPCLLCLKNRSTKKPLTLTLLMARFGVTDNAQYTVTTHHFTVTTNLFNRSTNFHDSTLVLRPSGHCCRQSRLSLTASAAIHTDGTSDEPEPET